VLFRSHAVVVRAEQALGFPPDVEVDEAIDEQVPDSLHWHLIATVNEAMSNVARHAEASTVLLRIALVGDHLMATVIDNGRGLPAERTESGLQNLRRRAQVAGGTMTLKAGPRGRGLELTWRVPLPDVDG